MLSLQVMLGMLSMQVSFQCSDAFNATHFDRGGSRRYAMQFGGGTEGSPLPGKDRKLASSHHRLTKHIYSTMAKLSTAIVSLALLVNGASALVPSNVPKTKRTTFDATRAATNTMAAASIASALVIGPMADAVDMAMDTPSFGSSSLVAERVTREGLYREYDVDLGDQVYDNADSTYKSAKETKSKKGKNCSYLSHKSSLLLYCFLTLLCSNNLLSFHRKIHCSYCCSRRWFLHHSHGSIFLVCQG